MYILACGDDGGGYNAVISPFLHFLPHTMKSLLLHFIWLYDSLWFHWVPGEVIGFDALFFLFGENSEQGNFLQCHCLTLHFSTNNFYSYLRGNYCWNGNNIPSAKEIPNRFYSQKKFSYYLFSFTLIMIVLKVHTFMHMSYYTILPHMKKKRSGYAHFTKKNFNTRKITMDMVFT